jgi:malic enzyme
LGWRKPRLRGAAYDAFIESFVEAVATALPGCVIQWEDFKQENAIKILERYRNTVPSFNDDIQGTGAVALAGLIAAMNAGGGSGSARMSDQRFLFYGAGAATLGIVRLLRKHLERAGASESERACAIIAMDSKGIVHEGRTDLTDGKSELAISSETFEALKLHTLTAAPTLEEIVKAVAPTALIGTSGQAGAFTEATVRALAAAAPAPLIWPLSNPTSCAEATPEEILQWSGGRALVATGSPFAPVTTDGTTHPISQANNVYIFPGVGLAAIAGRLNKIPDQAFLVAAEQLAALTPQGRDSIYPPLAQLRSISRTIAIAVVRAGVEAGWAPAVPANRIAELVDAAMWSPAYRPYLPA